MFLPIFGLALIMLVTTSVIIHGARIHNKCVESHGTNYAGSGIVKNGTMALLLFIMACALGILYVSLDKELSETRNIWIYFVAMGTNILIFGDHLHGKVAKSTSKKKWAWLIKRAYIAALIACVAGAIIN